MAAQDVIVVGGGVSGATFALCASRAGRRVLILERQTRLGGCLHTVRTPDGFWFELGAHTCYNSYRAFIEALERCGLGGELQRRAAPRLRFLDRGALLPGHNLGALLRLLDMGELLRSLPRLATSRQEGQTVYAYYSRIVGRGNYGRVLGPVLAAVPSQSADAFPAGMLFKKRSRRKDVLRSFTLRGGLQGSVEAMARAPGVTVRLAAAVEAVVSTGRGYAVALAGGERLEAPELALAVPPGAAAALLREAAPELAGVVARVRESAVDSLGFAVRAARMAHLPASTFLVPLQDAFHSVVTRDPVPDPSWRGFTFHFRPGLSPEARRRRAAEVLGIGLEEMAAVAERRSVLPSPVLGHREVVREVDRLLAGTRLALTGNWFGGLAIEDCAQRSRAEWERIASTSS